MSLPSYAALPGRRRPLTLDPCFEILCGSFAILGATLQRYQAVDKLDSQLLGDSGPRRPFRQRSFVLAMYGSNDVVNTFARKNVSAGVKILNNATVLLMSIRSIATARQGGGVASASSWPQWVATSFCRSLHPMKSCELLPW
ncbi:hypothetical protein B0H12DRAFT_1134316 [Mycena haematopus]|nr:hypothetical protein B0H12DRAFT_1134316 [Mycena haematopus]